VDRSEPGCSWVQVAVAVAAKSKNVPKIGTGRGLLLAQGTGMGNN